MTAPNYFVGPVPSVVDPFTDPFPYAATTGQLTTALAFEKARADAAYVPNPPAGTPDGYVATAQSGKATFLSVPGLDMSAVATVDF